MDPILITALAGGWTAFGALSAFVMRSVANGSWVPLRTHLRDIQLITESRDEWRSASKEHQANISLLARSQGAAADFFQKVPVTIDADPGKVL